MSEKIRLSLPVIVEGKYDKIKLESILDAKIITTGGFALFNNREKQAIIRRLSERGVIVLCDSDGAGNVIRSHIKSMLPPDKVYNLYIPRIEGKEKRKKTPSKEGTLGVEGIDAELLRALFRKYEDHSGQPHTEITKRDFYLLGLSGGQNSAAKRDELARAFGLPGGMSANALLDALNLIADLSQVETAVQNSR